MNHLNDKIPVFEVCNKQGHVYKIWADGRTEGFEAGALTINRVGGICDMVECLILEIELEKNSRHSQPHASSLRDLASRMGQSLGLFVQTLKRPEKSTAPLLAARSQ